MSDYNEKPKDNEWLKPLHQPSDTITLNRTEWEATKKDAERYRWLGDKHKNSEEEQWFVYGADGINLNIEIDAALEKSK